MRTRLVAVLVIALSLFLVRCGGQATPQPQAPAAAPTQASAAAAPTQAPAAAKPVNTQAPAAAAPTQAAAAPAAKAAVPTEGRVVYAQGSDPRLLHPYQVSGINEVNAIRQIFEKLIQYNRDTKQFDPVLAESWKWLDDKTLEMKIKQGIKFSNGEDLTTDAVVFSLNEWFKSEHWAATTVNFDHAEKVDGATIKIYHKKTFAPTINLTRLSQASWIVPLKYYQEVGPDKFGRQPIGTGPFVLKEWVKDDHMTFEVNPNYQGSSGPMPKFKTLVFRPIPEPAARIAALEAGDVDIIFDVAYSSIPRLNSNPSLQVLEVPGSRVMGIQMDMRYGLSDITKNQKVRQAFLTAIDRPAIIKSLFDGHAFELTQILMPDDFGYLDDAKPFGYDPAKSKQLLAEAGYPNGFEITFMCPSGRYILDKEACQAIAAQLEKVGVKSNMQFLEVGDFFNKALTGKLGPISYIGTGPGTGHAIDRMNANSCRYNASFKCEQDYEDLMAKAEVTLDTAEQKKLLQDLIRLDLANPGRIPLWATNDTWAVTKRVQGWKPRVDQELWMFGVSVGK